MTDDESCCKPGDITVGAVHRGFAVGRALEPRSAGPWEYVTEVQTFEKAVALARTLAREGGANVWFHTGARRCRSIPVDPSQPIDFTLDEDGNPR